MEFISGINVTCDKCNFIVNDYILVQTFTDEDDQEKHEFLCRQCAVENGLPVEYDGKTVKTIGLFVGE